MNQPEVVLSTFFEIIVYAGMVQGFYAAFVLSHTKHKNPANRYLSYLLIVLSVSILHSTFIIPYFHNFHHTTFDLKEPFLLLAIPFIWLYVKKLNEPQFFFRIKHLLHFAPFLIVILVSSLIFMHNPTQINGFFSHKLAINIAIYIITFSQFLFYLIYILRLLGHFKVKALNELSNTENIDPNWLKIFLLTFLAVFGLLIAMIVISVHQFNVDYFNNLVSIIFAIVIFVLGYKGLFQQSLPISSTLLNQIEENANYLPSEDSKIDENLLNRLFLYMQQQKPYHDPELTLTSLASQLTIGRNLLSEIINTGTSGNFYDFVNKYRVEEVKQLMENSKYKDYTILAIAFEAGFPSKSTFNSIFKKFTGLTPSEYRNRLS